jgi:hypothetical protein
MRTRLQKKRKREKIARLEKLGKRTKRVKVERSAEEKRLPDVKVPLYIMLVDPHMVLKAPDPGYVVYTEEVDMVETKDVCVICQDTSRCKKGIRLICGHVFDTRCIVKWLSKKPQTFTEQFGGRCPHCRTPVVEVEICGHRYITQS